MADRRDQVVVQLDSAELGSPREVAVLSRERSGSKTVLSFEYRPEWIATQGAFALDPSLPLFEGEQYGLMLPGIFADAAPDRWGRTLLERREALLARREQRRPQRLDDWDLLVGVHDFTRMGALRLRGLRDGAFLGDAPLVVPPITRLRELEFWAGELEQGLPRPGTDEEQWIAMLIAPGSSLGGARPKANFLSNDRNLWIAKFPSLEDHHDVGAWEYVVTKLAAEAGIEIPKISLLKLGAVQRTFAAERFDRSGNQRRLYASAMTLAGKRDGEEASYLDMVQAIERLVDPAAIQANLEQLFRRVVFNCLIANRDDHLRNHGFLRSARGWRLAPVFDINPTPQKLEHSLSFDGSQRAPDLQVVRETAPLYRLPAGSAQRIIREVREAVRRWHDIARRTGIPGEEIERLAPAFETLIHE